MLAREKWQGLTIRVLEDVFEERKRQVAKYGHNDELDSGMGPDSMWLRPFGAVRAIFIERSLRREYERYEREHGNPTWMHLILEEVAEAFAEEDLDRQETELLQVAALAISRVETIRKQRKGEI